VRQELQALLVQLESKGFKELLDLLALQEALELSVRQGLLVLKAWLVLQALKVSKVSRELQELQAPQVLQEAKVLLD
jgi:hypothetical protein